MLKHGVTVERERQTFEARIRGCEVKAPPGEVAPTKMTSENKKNFDNMIDKITQTKLREMRGRGR